MSCTVKNEALCQSIDMKFERKMKSMSALVIVLTIIQLLCALALVVVVLLQSGKSAGLSGALVGNNDPSVACEIGKPCKGDAGR